MPKGHAPSALPLAACLLPLLLGGAGCGGAADAPGASVRVTISASEVGREAELLRAQLDRFMAERPGIDVEIQSTPDAADQRHQLYVQWLNARVGQPDILQLDVVWTPEFAAAGWILPLDLPTAERDFFPATLAANRWNGRLWAVPWFVDVGMLYWRTDLLERAPESLDELARVARAPRPDERAGPPGRSELAPWGFVWQGARYEGLVTVYLEILGAYGGAILDDDGRVRVDDPPAVRALRFLADMVRKRGVTPRDVLSWREEQTRFAFQNGEAVLMRNWPYAYPLLEDSAESRVAGRFAVAPMPGAEGGSPTAALGGAQLAVNAHSRHPEAALAVVRYLTDPERMLERARALGQFPSRPALYDDPTLADALAIPAAEAKRIILQARPRPVIPVYTELSGILQLWLHRALTGQREPEEALHEAADEIERLLQRVQLAPPPRAAR